MWKKIDFEEEFDFISAENVVREDKNYQWERSWTNDVPQTADKRVRPFSLLRKKERKKERKKKEKLYPFSPIFWRKHDTTTCSFVLRKHLQIKRGVEIEEEEWKIERKRKQKDKIIKELKNER